MNELKRFIALSSHENASFLEMVITNNNHHHIAVAFFHILSQSNCLKAEYAYFGKRIKRVK